MVFFLYLNLLNQWFPTPVLEPHYPACFRCFTAFQQVFRFFRSPLITHSYKSGGSKGNIQNMQDRGAWGPGLETTELNSKMCYFQHHGQLYLVRLSPLSMRRVTFTVSRYLAAAEGGDGTGLFQIIRHQLQNGGNFLRHRYSLCLQDLPFCFKTMHLSH